MNHFGINFALDYQGFPSRAKLDIKPDSLFLPGTDFTFSDWESFTFLISPRFVYPLSEDIDLFTELSVGFALSASPTIIAERSGLEIAEIEGSRTLSLAAGGAIGSGQSPLPRGGGDAKGKAAGVSPALLLARFSLLRFASQPG